MKHLKVVASLIFACAAPAALAGQQLITNGGFESGFSGWTIANQAGGSGDWYNSAGGTSPMSGMSIPGPHSGAFYAVTDQLGPGSHTMFQKFTLSSAATSATLSFSHFLANYAGQQGSQGAQNNFDYNAVPNQRIQVDLVAGDISGNPFGGVVLANFFTGGTDFAWTTFSQNVTALLGPGTYSLRFAEVDNQGFFNYGLDDVSLIVQTSTVPEPGSIAMVGFGLAALVGFNRRRARTT